MSAVVHRRRILAGGASALAALLLAACGGSGPGPAGEDVAITHVHGVARDLATGTVVIATHEGLFRLQDGAWVGGGQSVDLMGFAISPEGTYLGSGHPGPGLGLPEPVGLARSTDEGRTWSSVSRGGESDFHALTAGPGTIVGFDGALRVSRDGTTWTQAQIPAPPRSLAASPETGTLLATTERGLLRSRDSAGTWETLTPPELLVVVAWADERTIVGAGVDGRLHTSRDEGATWSTSPAWIGTVQAIWAGPTDDGGVETLLVVGTRVLRTVDGGATTEQLGT